MIICPFLQELLPKLFLRILGLDGSALHNGWSNLKTLLLVVLDGNGSPFTVACAIVLSEHSDHVWWFLQRVDKHFPGYFNNI